MLNWLSQSIRLNTLLIWFCTVIYAPTLQAFSITEWYNNLSNTAIGQTQFLFSNDFEMIPKETAMPSAPPIETNLNLDSETPETPAPPKDRNIKPRKRVALPFHGYLPDIGPSSFRFKTVSPPINRLYLVPSPLPMPKEDETADNDMDKQKPEETLHDMISSIIEEEFTATLDEEESTTPTAEENADVNSEVPSPVIEPPASQEPAETTDYTEFLNPDEIILYFEEQTQNDNTTRNSVGLPLRIPAQNTPQASPYPSRATFEQN